jgi:hypothetical protein
MKCKKGDKIFWIDSRNKRHYEVARKIEHDKIWVEGGGFLWKEEITNCNIIPPKKKDRVVKGWWCTICEQASITKKGVCEESTIPCTIVISAKDWKKIKGGK